MIMGKNVKDLKRRRDAFIDRIIGGKVTRPLSTLAALRRLQIDAHTEICLNTDKEVLSLLQKIHSDTVTLSYLLVNKYVDFARLGHTSVLAYLIDHHFDVVGLVDEV